MILIMPDFPWMRLFFRLPCTFPLNFFNPQSMPFKELHLGRLPKQRGSSTTLMIVTVILILKLLWGTYLKISFSSLKQPIISPSKPPALPVRLPQVLPFRRLRYAHTRKSPLQGAFPSFPSCVPSNHRVMWYGTANTTCSLSKSTAGKFCPVPSEPRLARSPENWTRTGPYKTFLRYF